MRAQAGARAGARILIFSYMLRMRVYTMLKLAVGQSVQDRARAGVRKTKRWRINTRILDSTLTENSQRASANRARVATAGRRYSGTSKAKKGLDTQAVVMQY